MPNSTNSIDELYHEAYALVEQGICYDEVGRRNEAQQMYEKGLEQIEKATNLPNAKSSEHYQKMCGCREHIENRLSDLNPGMRSLNVESNPPPYESISKTIDLFGSKDVDEIFLIPFGVQLFMIQGDDTTVPTYPEPLKIFQFHPNDTRNTGDAKAFMQVGSWVYPLIPGRSTTMASDFGAFVFPNPTAEQPDLYVAVLLPQDLDAATENAFREILKEYTELRTQSVTRQLSHEEDMRLTQKLAVYLVKSGETIAWGFRKGADKTSKIVANKGESYRRQSTKADKPVNIDPRVQTSVHYLRKGSKVAVKVTGYLLDRIGEIGVNLGKKISSSVEKKVGDSKGGGLVTGTFDLIGGGVTGAATIWMGMEEAGKTLARNIANETVHSVDHKYGEQAAKSTNDAMYAAGHSTMTALNIADLGLKGIAKRTASKAGMTVLKDLGQKKNEEEKRKDDENMKK